MHKTNDELSPLLLLLMNNWWAAADKRLKGRSNVAMWIDLIQCLSTLPTLSRSFRSTPSPSPLLDRDQGRTARCTCTCTCTFTFTCTRQWSSKSISSCSSTCIACGSTCTSSLRTSAPLPERDTRQEKLLFTTQASKNHRQGKWVSCGLDIKIRWYRFYTTPLLLLSHYIIRYPIVSLFFFFFFFLSNKQGADCNFSFHGCNTARQKNGCWAKTTHWIHPSCFRASPLSFNSYFPVMMIHAKICLSKRPSHPFNRATTSLGGSETEQAAKQSNK